LSCIDGWGCKDPLDTLGSCSEPATQSVCEYCYNDGRNTSTPSGRNMSNVHHFNLPCPMS
jgi:hypothetical protein